MDTNTFLTIAIAPPRNLESSRNQSTQQTQGRLTTGVVATRHSPEASVNSSLLPYIGMGCGILLVGLVALILTKARCAADNPEFYDESYESSPEEMIHY